ncbi:hypothetical protein BCR35DRAFT_308745 [Leucosporidium creatinivorum]|uniref:Transmembrane protein n=1 Tax=Leucosporidium creatinivorum TaxID=106004 RepID=A0A1Y2DXF5_9BASI|nr:hypothetical protein BCR35DRAFT_308745 [Leucosporidium creatinivorum]
MGSTKADERNPLFHQPAPPPPYEDGSSSYSTTSSHQLNAQAVPFIPTAFTAQQQPCPHPHPHYVHLPPPRRTFTPLGPTPYHTLPPPVSYEREHAIRLADRRARRRFFSALCWGVLLYLGISAAVTAGMHNQQELRRGAENAWRGIKRWLKQLERDWDPERLSGSHGMHIFPNVVDSSSTALPANLPSAELNAEGVQ